MDKLEGLHMYTLVNSDVVRAIVIYMYIHVHIHVHVHTCTCIYILYMYRSCIVVKRPICMYMLYDSHTVRVLVVEVV